MTDYQAFLYEEFPELLKKVNSDMPALWGKMDAQQMVEHLAYVLSISNGRLQVDADAEPERLAYRKMRFFEKDVPFTRSIRVKFVPEEPDPYIYADIEQSKNFVLQQLERFYEYHQEHPDIQPVHPNFGPMNYEEWVQLQARHLRHHLTQFGVIFE
jgi:Protein of unknown function (DUF1569)